MMCVWGWRCTNPTWRGGTINRVIPFVRHSGEKYLTVLTRFKQIFTVWISLSIGRSARIPTYLFTGRITHTQWRVRVHELSSFVNAYISQYFCFKSDKPARIDSPPAVARSITHILCSLFPQACLYVVALIARLNSRIEVCYSAW